MNWRRKSRTRRLVLQRSAGSPKTQTGFLPAAADQHKSLSGRNLQTWQQLQLTSRRWRSSSPHETEGGFSRNQLEMIRSFIWTKEPCLCQNFYLQEQSPNRLQLSGDPGLQNAEDEKTLKVLDRRFQIWTCSPPGKLTVWFPAANAGKPPLWFGSVSRTSEHTADPVPRPGNKSTPHRPSNDSSKRLHCQVVKPWQKQQRVSRLTEAVELQEAPPPIWEEDAAEIHWHTHTQTHAELHSSRQEHTQHITPRHTDANTRTHQITITQKETHADSHKHTHTGGCWRVIRQIPG